MASLRHKLVEVYKKIDHIEKKGTNTKQGYKFVRSADVLHALRNAFAELGVYAQPNVDLLGTYDIKTNSGGSMHTATVKVTIVLHDLESDEKLTVSGLGDGADSGDKGIYKAQTGGIKNALRNAFLVPDEADPEADESVDEQTQEEEPPRESRLKRITPRQAIAKIEDGPDSVPLAVASGIPPTKEELDKYRQRVVDLTKELVDSGELKPIRGQRVGTKVLAYILKETKTPDANQITISQWEKLFSSINTTKSVPNGLKELAMQIEKASNKGE